MKNVPLRLAALMAVLFVSTLGTTALAQLGGGLQYFRPYDQRGINTFETPKVAGAAYEGMRLNLGASFAQQMQGLRHSNAADANVVDNVNLNELMKIGTGFNTATANLYMDAQLAQGLRVHLATYLSSRHHPEAWVKGGYLQVDELGFLGVPALNPIMDYLSIRVGHFGINYGDAQFRRSDNAQALYNPFVENYLLDAFATEIGAEVTAQYAGFIGVAGLTGGEIQGMVTRPDDRGISLFGKLGYDTQVMPDLRLRLTGSAYTTSTSANNTLYAGDRAGSRYYMVMENTKATVAANFTSGRINPGFNDEVTAFMVNPFVKFHGFELFGLYENAQGRRANETENRTWQQYAVDAIYRFLPREQLFVGVRYNRAEGDLAFGPARQKVSADRVQAGLGWFVTPNVLVKGEYVTQRYLDFPTTDIRHAGKFNGFMIEGVVAF